MQQARLLYDVGAYTIILLYIFLLVDIFYIPPVQRSSAIKS